MYTSRWCICKYCLARNRVPTIDRYFSDVRRETVLGCDEGKVLAKELVRSCVGEKGLGLGCCSGGGLCCGYPVVCTS